MRDPAVSPLRACPPGPAPRPARRPLRGAGLVLSLATLLGACASSAKFEDRMDDEVDLATGPDDDLSGGGGEDQRMSLERDLRQSPGEDLSGRDLSAPPDLSMAPDLSAAPDLSTPPDLTAPPDLAPITGCEVAPQSGCPAGLKCTTHDAVVSLCDPNGAVARGKACTVTSEVDNCAAGGVCIDEGGGKSQCRQFCHTDAQCQNARSFCDFDLDAGMKFRVCTQPCNAIYPGAGCEPGYGCFVYGREHTDCQPAGTMDVNMPCAKAADCKSGLACIGPAGASLCRRVCRRGDDSGCGGQFCFDVRSGTYTWPTYGVCCPLAGC